MNTNILYGDIRSFVYSYLSQIAYKIFLQGFQDKLSFDNVIPFNINRLLSIVNLHKSIKADKYTDNLDASSKASEEVAQTLANSNPSQKAAELLDKYGNAILRVAYSYLHNMSDSEDILQDTLIQYIKKTPTFENEKHEKAWLLTVAANLSKNKIEYLGIRKTDELSEELVAENKEDLAFVWDAVKQLPEKFREVIHLFYQEGYSTKEIADILKRNESTVRSDLNRARQQLKNILKEAYDFE